MTGYFTRVVGEVTNGFLNITFRRSRAVSAGSGRDFTLEGCPAYHLIFAYGPNVFTAHRKSGYPNGP